MIEFSSNSGDQQAKSLAGPQGNACYSQKIIYWDTVSCNSVISFGKTQVPTCLNFHTDDQTLKISHHFILFQDLSLVTQNVLKISRFQCLTIILKAKAPRLPPPGGEGATRYILGWGGVAPAPHTLALFKTKIADFPSLFKTEFRFLTPCLRHLTRNHTLCKTIINIKTLSYLIHWQSQNYLQLGQQSHKELCTLST